MVILLDQLFDVNDALRGKRLLFAACGSAHNILLTLDDAGSPGYESATTADSFY